MSVDTSYSLMGPSSLHGAQDYGQAGQLVMDVRNHQQPQQALNMGAADGMDDEDGVEDGPNPRKRQRKEGSSKRKKVGHACLYCRRSHMTCDEGRPCQRCIKREIGHLCHDDPKTAAPTKGAPFQPAAAPAEKTEPPAATANAPAMDVLAPPPPAPPVPMPQGQFMPFSSNGMQGMQPQLNPWELMAQGPSLFPSETLGSEFNVLSDFLDTLEDRSFFNTTPLQGLTPNLGAAPRPSTSRLPDMQPPAFSPSDVPPPPPPPTFSQPQPQPQPQPAPNPIPAASKTERFLLTAADQEPGTRDERLQRVIRAKYEAGLLKPYNYVTGYARLTRWMDRNVSPDSRQQILQALSVFRPAFRAIAQGLRDIDLVFIEEAFERLLLDYDRVFSAMGIPACLWRRTGEIYKGNKEFADLVGLPHELLREGRLCIYELMAEESSVNYWEKYSQIAFDPAQKAVLTTCVLRFKPSLNLSSSSNSSRPTTATATGHKRRRGGGGAGGQEAAQAEEKYINCCFSFTIRRDTYGIPCMVVGNFIRC